MLYLNYLCLGAFALSVDNFRIQIPTDNGRCLSPRPCHRLCRFQAHICMRILPIVCIKNGEKKDKKCAGRSRLQNVIIIVARGYYLSSRFDLKTNEFSMNACLCTPLVFRDGYVIVFCFPAIICLSSKDSPALPRNWHAHIFAQSTPAAQRVWLPRARWRVEAASCYFAGENSL